MKKCIYILLLFATTNIVSVKAQKRVSLKPDFKNNISWWQSIKAVTSWDNKKNIQKQVFDLSMQATITEFDNEKPIKIIYDNVNGPQTVVKVKNGAEKTTDSLMNRYGKITADIDKSNVLFNANDIGALSNDILKSFPPGSFFGFIPPGKKKIKVGASWSSGSVIPIGPRVFSKKKYQFYEIKGVFKLEKIENNIAYVLWEGEAKVTTKSNENSDASWQRMVEFDFKKGRFISNKGKLQIKTPNWDIIYKVDIVAGY
ncbi:MAG: hypothetical protein B6I20_13825 [Bacteroidetes bacterium 4572_117]|nr:MAG: hypothetical protein B6I20_13825 [Bacteroidetes bacterium 4572_117]